MCEASEIKLQLPAHNGDRWNLSRFSCNVSIERLLLMSSLIENCICSPFNAFLCASQAGFDSLFIIRRVFLRFIHFLKQINEKSPWMSVGGWSRVRSAVLWRACMCARGGGCLHVRPKLQKASFHTTALLHVCGKMLEKVFHPCHCEPSSYEQEMVVMIQFFAVCNGVCFFLCAFSPWCDSLCVGGGLCWGRASRRWRGSLCSPAPSTATAPTPSPSS